MSNCKLPKKETPMGREKKHLAFTNKTKQVDVYGENKMGIEEETKRKEGWGGR